MGTKTSKRVSFKMFHHLINFNKKKQQKKESDCIQYIFYCSLIFANFIYEREFVTIQTIVLLLLYNKFYHLSSFLIFELNSWGKKFFRFSALQLCVFVRICVQLSASILKIYGDIESFSNRFHKILTGI